jgi:hypothetical protein
LNNSRKAATRAYKHLCGTCFFDVLHLFVTAERVVALRARLDIVWINPTLICLRARAAQQEVQRPMSGKRGWKTKKNGK